MRFLNPTRGNIPPLAKHHVCGYRGPGTSHVTGVLLYPGLGALRPTGRSALMAEGRRGEKTAEDIRAVAIELFYKRGFQATALLDVAAKVGIQVGSLYNHISWYSSRGRLSLEEIAEIYTAMVLRGIWNPAAGRLESHLEQIATALAPRAAAADS